MRSFVSLLAAGGLAAALLLTGCGSSLECGAGTVARDGFCVQQNPMSCDPDTAELVDGVCVAKETGGTCGPGTKQNPVNPEECIPDCGAGAALDPVTKKCVPESALVQPNVTEKASDEDNDPMNEGGVPIDFTLPTIGQSTVIAGVVGAPFEDEDGYLWADWDGWKFSTTGPTLLEIEGLDVSHIRTAFYVAPADDAYSIERFGYNGEGDHARRKLFIPRSGDWVLMVSDSENFNALWNGNTGGYATVVGFDDPTFNYAVRIYQLALPGFDNLAPATPMTGSYEDGPRFYSIAPTIGQVVEFWNIADGANTYGATEFFSPETTYRRASYGSLTLARGSSDTLYFVADLYGSMDSDLGVTYEAIVVTPEDLGAVSSTAVTRNGVVLATAGATKYYKFTVTGDNLINVTIAPSSGANADAVPAVALYDAQMNRIFALTDAPSPTFRPGTGSVEYILRVTDGYGGGGADFTYDLAVSATSVTVTAESEPNDAVGTADVGTGFPLVFTGNIASSSDKDYYSFTLASASDVNIMTTDPGALGLITAVQLYNAAGTTLIDEADGADSLGCYLGYAEYCLASLEETALAAGTYILVVSSAYTPGNYQVVIMAP